MLSFPPSIPPSTYPSLRLSLLLPIPPSAYPSLRLSLPLPIPPSAYPSTRCTLSIVTVTSLLVRRRGPMHTSKGREPGRMRRRKRRKEA